MWRSVSREGFAPACITPMSAAATQAVRVVVAKKTGTMFTFTQTPHERGEICLLLLIISASVGRATQEDGCATEERRRQRRMSPRCGTTRHPSLAMPLSMCTELTHYLHKVHQSSCNVPTSV